MATHLEGCIQLDDVLMGTAAVQADLPVNLVLVELADAAHEVALEHHHLTGALADGLVHCRTPQEQEGDTHTGQRSALVAQHNQEQTKS